VSAALGFDSDKYIPRREVSTIGSTASTRDSPRKSLIRTKGVASRWHGGRVRPTESTPFADAYLFHAPDLHLWVGSVDANSIHRHVASATTSRSSAKSYSAESDTGTRSSDEKAGIGPTYFDTLVRSRTRVRVKDVTSCRGRYDEDVRPFFYLYVT
jgi:hypothetical protein